MQSCAIPNASISSASFFDMMLTGNYSVLQLLKLSKKWGLKTRPAKTGAGKAMSRSNLYKISKIRFTMASLNILADRKLVSGQA